MTDPTEPQKPQRNAGMLIPIGSILGAGIGAAIGTANGSLSPGIWIGAMIGVGLGMLGIYLTS